MAVPATCLRLRIMMKKPTDITGSHTTMLS